jgi:hypothetical protein
MRFPGERGTSKSAGLHADRRSMLVREDEGRHFNRVTAMCLDVEELQEAEQSRG